MMDEPVLERVFPHPIWPMPGVNNGETIQIIIAVTMALLDFHNLFIIQKNDKTFFTFY
jgi:hypothetical protein